MVDFIGWTLVHAAWECGIIAIVVAVGLRLTRRRGSSIRYTAALTGLALTIAGPIATTIAVNPPGRSGASHLSPRPPSGTGSPVAAFRASPGAVRVVDVTSSQRGVPLLEQLRRRIDASLAWLVLAWVLGIAVLSLRTFAGIAHVRRLGREGVSSIDAQLRAVVDRLADRLGMRSAVRVLHSTQVDGPMVVGWLRPAVLVPVGLLTCVAPSQLEMILAHELAHIRRYDTIVNLAQTIVETLLFFHPAVWWISARVRDERENCCDDLAIATCGDDRHAYGSTLLLLEEARVNVELAAAAADGSLLRRVQRIVIGAPAPVDLGATWFAGVATMLIVLFLMLPTLAPAASTPQPTVRSDTMPSSTSLLAGAALTVATSVAATHGGSTTLAARRPLDVSGRWVAVSGSVHSPGAESSFDTLTIEQTDRALFLLGDGARLTFQVEGSDRGSIRIKGPTAASVDAGHFGLAINLADSAAPSGRVSAQWEGGKLELTSKLSSAKVNLITMVLRLDPAGNLVVEEDYPASDNAPAKHSVQHYRRL